MAVERTRSRHRPHDHRPRVERHQGTEHAGAARRSGSSWSSRTSVRAGLLGADAGLAARHDLHQGPARHRPAHDGRRQRVAQASARARRPGPTGSRPRASTQIQADPALMTDRARRPAARCSATIAPPATGATRKGGQGFPNLTDDAWLWGGDARDDRRDHPRRHQLDRIPTAAIADAGLRPRRHARARRDRQRRRLCAQPVRSATATSCAADDDRRRQGRVRRQLRRLPWRGRQGQRRTSARPNLTDQFWIYGGDAAVDLRRRSGAAGRAICRPGKSACRRSTARSSRSICSTSEEQQPMSATRRSDAADRTTAVALAAVGAGLLLSARRQCASRLRRRDVAAGLRRACPTGRRLTRRLDSSARRNRPARRGRRSMARPTMTPIPAVVPPLPRARTAGSRNSLAAAAFGWLAAGWRDLSDRPGASLAYGLLVFLVSVVIVVGLFAFGLGLHPVPGLRRLHGRRPAPRDRPLREEPAHRGRASRSAWRR